MPTKPNTNRPFLVPGIQTVVILLGLFWSYHQIDDKFDRKFDSISGTVGGNDKTVAVQIAHLEDSVKFGFSRMDDKFSGIEKKVDAHQVTLDSIMNIVRGWRTSQTAQTDYHDETNPDPHIAHVDTMFLRSGKHSGRYYVLTRKR